jgi:hypothetical protein
MYCRIVLLKNSVFTKEEVAAGEAPIEIFAMEANGDPIVKVSNDDTITFKVKGIVWGIDIHTREIDGEYYTAFEAPPKTALFLRYDVKGVVTMTAEPIRV